MGQCCHLGIFFQLESILVIVPLGCLYKSLQILLRCPDQKHCLILFSCTKSLSSLELSVQRMNCTLICQLKQSHLNYFHISTLIQKLFILHKGSSRAFCTFIPTFFVFNDLTDSLHCFVRYDFLFLKDGKAEMRWPTWEYTRSVHPCRLVMPNCHSMPKVVPSLGMLDMNMEAPQRVPTGPVPWSPDGHGEPAALRVRASRPGILQLCRTLLFQQNSLSGC